MEVMATETSPVTVPSNLGVTTQPLNTSDCDADVDNDSFDNGTYVYILAAVSVFSTTFQLLR